MIGTLGWSAFGIVVFFLRDQLLHMMLTAQSVIYTTIVVCFYTIVLTLLLFAAFRLLTQVLTMVISAMNAYRSIRFDEKGSIYYVTDRRSASHDLSV